MKNPEQPRQNEYQELSQKELLMSLLENVGKRIKDLSYGSTPHENQSGSSEAIILGKLKELQFRINHALDLIDNNISLPDEYTQPNLQAQFIKIYKDLVN